MYLCFLQGRDFESAYVNHKYTEKERQTLGSFESLDYLPSHSIIYKHWIKRQPARYKQRYNLPLSKNIQDLKF